MGGFCEASGEKFRNPAIFRIKPLIALTAWLFTCLPGQAYTIEGKIEHVEQLPPVEQKFNPGAHFDLSAELSPDNVWVKIPAWLAGSWAARDETAVYFQDFKKGISRNLNESFKAKQDFTYGHQVDKNGQVWHYLGVPYTSKSVHTSYEEIHEVREKQLLKATDELAEFRSVYTVLFIDNFTSNIQRTQQQESLTTYSPIADDRIAMTASSKVFDAAGRAQTLQRNEAIIKRYKHFSPVNEKDGKDLKALFQQFMRARGYEGQSPAPVKSSGGSAPVYKPGSDF
ncbi:MAG: hypothetical protein JSS83_10550 [Cyanobacteria bacterium SZAS LIN-3]|nr:hypothetical protein [Cyanobacteria bacterium SZAS LIN-3]